jgi:hypothetical protein
MAFELSSTLRERLRTELLARFDRDSFALFLSDQLGIANFRSIVPETSFESQCQAFIIRQESEAKLEHLCIELRDWRASVPGLVDIAIEILGAMKPVAGPGGRQSLMIGQRPFLNREDLRGKLTSFVEGSRLERVLVIQGKAATGKSYSRHLISHSARMQFAAAELPAIREGEYEASHIANAISVRLWPDERLERFDDLGQQARDDKWYGDRLVARLARLTESTLLFIDGFNLARLSEGAAELLIRLCRAVENGECKNLWLVFVGLEAERLGSEYEGIVDPEQACPPAKTHIEDFLKSIPRRSGRTVDAVETEAAAARLAAVLGPEPTHATWAEFSRQLMQECKKIRMS